MKRKILNSTLIVLLAAATLLLGYRLFNRLTHPEVNLMEAVPPTAAVVIQLDQPFELWRKLSGANLMWDELKAVSPFIQIHRAAQVIDSLSSNDKEFASFVFGKQLVASIHPSGNEGVDLLFTFAQKGKDESELIALVKRSLKLNSDPESRAVKNDKLYTLPNAGSNWSLLIKNGFISVASSAALAESVAAHLEEGKNITTENGWSKIYTTGDPKAEANIFLHHKNFSSLLNNWVSADLRDALSTTNPYALFSELDLSLSSGTISMNGFSLISDSSNYFLSIFNEHEAQEFTAARILPENTAGFLWLGINDGESFHSSIEKWMEKAGSVNDHQQLINSFNSENDCNIRQHLLSWIGTEIVLFSNGKQDSSDRNEDLFLAIRINELSDPLQELNELALKLDTTGGKSTLNGGIDIRRLAADDLFGMIFGQIFSGIDQPWYFRIEDFIVFANSAPALEAYLRDVSSEKSLAKNITYYNFVSENLSDKANLTVYANPSRSASLFNQLLDPAKALRFTEQEALIKKFDAFAWQMSKNKAGLYYNNLYLKYNPGGKQDSKSLWELALDTTVTQQPMFIRNHMTGTQDIVVQDENYSLYLISGKGEVLWKKELEEKIIGTVRQIDYFGNGKLQLLFTTRSGLHLIDLKGNYMNGFPVRLNADVSGELGVFDYESNNNYRILVPVGNKIVNVDKDGKITTGWEFAGSSSSICQAPVFFRCENKDYLFISDDKGEMHIVDRKGKPRYNINFDLNGRSSNEVILEAGTTIENTAVVYSDSSGSIKRVYLNGNADTAFSGKRSPYHRFVLADANEDGKKDIVILDSNRIEIREWDGKILGRYEFAERVAGKLMNFRLKDGSARFGVYSTSSGELYLIMGDGSMHGKFPLKGSSPFSLSDINGDGSYEIVSGTGTRRIVCYSFN